MGYRFCVVEHIADIISCKSIVFIGTYYEASKAGFTPSNLTLYLPAHPLLAPSPCSIAKLFFSTKTGESFCVVGLDSARIYPAVIAALIRGGLPYPLARIKASQAGFSPITLAQSEGGRIVYALRRFDLVRECDKGCRTECRALFELEFAGVGVQFKEDVLDHICSQLCCHAGRHIEGLRVHEHGGRLLVRVWAYGGRDAPEDIPERVERALSNLALAVDRDVEVAVEYRLWPPHYCSEAPCI